jgi:hypothetical protein
VKHCAMRQSKLFRGLRCAQNLCGVASCHTSMLGQIPRLCKTQQRVSR